MLTTLLLRSRSAVPDLHRLDRVDAHQRVGDVGIQSVEHRLSEPRRNTRSNHCDPGTNRVAFATNLPKEVLQLLNPPGIGTEERVLIGKRRLDGVELEGADLTQVAEYSDT